MAQALIYTSVMKGLKTGSKGFCTVASTQGMAKNLGDRLEGLSGYRHLFSPGDPNASKNPVKFSHVIFRIAGVRYNALSRVADCGLDYSQRTNKIAHHIALEGAELSPAGPAWLLAKPGVMETAWQGDPRQLPPPSFPTAAVNAGICHTWKKLAGDAGWGGVLAEATLNKKTIYIVFRPGVDVLPAIQEAVALLPANKRWEATFTTYYQNLPAGVECNWRCVVEGSDEARRALRDPRMTAIDLCAAGTAAPEGPWVEAARTGRTPELGKEAHLDWNRAARRGPAPIDVGTEAPPVDTSAGAPPDLATGPPEVPFLGSPLEPAQGDFVSTPAGSPTPVFRAKAKSNNSRLIIGASVLFLFSALLFLAFTEKGKEVVARISGSKTKESRQAEGKGEAEERHPADGSHNPGDLDLRARNGGNGKKDRKTQNSKTNDSQGKGTTDASKGGNDTGNQVKNGGDNKPPDEKVDPVTPPPASPQGTPLKDVPSELAFAMAKRNGGKTSFRKTGLDRDVYRVFPLGSEEPVGFDVRELKVSLLCPVLNPPKSGKPLDKTPFHLVETGSEDSDKKWELKWRLGDSVGTIGTLEFTKPNESGRKLEFSWVDGLEPNAISSPKPEIQMGIFDLLQGCIVKLSHGDQHRHVFFSLRDPKPGNASDFAVERLFTDTPVMSLSTGVSSLQGDRVRAKFDVITLVSGETSLEPKLDDENIGTALLSMTQKADNQKVDSGVTNYEFNILIKPQGAAGTYKVIDEKPAEARLLIDIQSDGQPLTLKVTTRVVLQNPYAGITNFEANGTKLCKTTFGKLKEKPPPILVSFKAERKNFRDRFGKALTERNRLSAKKDKRFDEQLKNAEADLKKGEDLCMQQQSFWLAHQTLRALVAMGPPQVFAKSPVIVLEREYRDSASDDLAKTQWIEITRTTWLSP